MVVLILIHTKIFILKKGEPNFPSRMRNSFIVLILLLQKFFWQ